MKPHREKNVEQNEYRKRSSRTIHFFFFRSFFFSRLQFSNYDLLVPLSKRHLSSSFPIIFSSFRIRMRAVVSVTHLRSSRLGRSRNSFDSPILLFLATKAQYLKMIMKFEDNYFSATERALNERKRFWKYFAHFDIFFARNALTFS